MHGIARLPERLKVVNPTGNPVDTNVLDADTGEQVMGVFSVHVERNEMTLEASLNWPVTMEDYVIADPERWGGPQHDGVKTAILKLPIRKLDVETW